MLRAHTLQGVFLCLGEDVCLMGGMVEPPVVTFKDWFRSSLTHSQSPSLSLLRRSMSFMLCLLMTASPGPCQPGERITESG